MWYQATVAAPTVEPISLERARRACRIEHTDDDLLLTDCIAVARAHIEAYCGIRIASRTGVAMLCDGWSDMANLPDAPISSVTSITYIDTDGATQTLATSVYEARLDDLSPGIVLKYGQTWPSIRTGSRITLTVVLGYTVVPPPVLAACDLYVRHLYNIFMETGGLEESLPVAFHDVLTNFRRFAQ